MTACHGSPACLGTPGRRRWLWPGRQPPGPPQLAVDRRRGSHQTPVGTARQPPTATRASPTMTGQITQDPPWSFLALGPGRRQKAAARAPGPQTRPRRASGLRPTHTGHTRAQPPRGHNDRQTPLHRAQGRRRPPDHAQGLRLRPPQPHGPLRAETWPETWCRRGRPRPGPSRAAGDAGFGARRGGARVSAGCACVCGSLWPESSRREGLRSQRQGQEGPRGDARPQREAREPAARRQVRLSTRPSSGWAAHTAPPGPHRSGCTSSGGPNPESPSPRGSERKTWRPTCR